MMGGSYSDSEPEVFYPYYCPPPPPPLARMVRPAGLAKMRFSSGSLQLDEEEEEEEAVAAAEVEKKVVKEETKKEEKDEKKGKTEGEEAKVAAKITKVAV